MPKEQVVYGVNIWGFEDYKLLGLYEKLEDAQELLEAMNKKHPPHYGDIWHGIQLIKFILNKKFDREIRSVVIKTVKWKEN